MLGNIRFIGELYKESMLTERIMHAFIMKLIGEFQHAEDEKEKEHGEKILSAEERWEKKAVARR